MTAPGTDRQYVFVSCASVNRERVITVVDTLEAHGVSTWFDRSDIPGGTSYGPEIVSGIKNATAIVLMCSEAALASRNVRQEIQLSWRHERPILPLLLEPLVFPDDVAYWLEGAQWIEVLDEPAEHWLDPVRRALALMGYSGLTAVTKD
ncbi:MAG: toll/interleukin-1 receptor domain-containing protein, partial [Thermomicrobiales bacterium]